MKLKDIKVGGKYVVLIPLHVDTAAWHAWRYDRERTTAEVVEVGVHYDVPRRVTYGGIAGTPSVIAGYDRSERADGVKVKFGRYGAIGVIPARNVKWEAER